MRLARSAVVIASVLSSGSAWAGDEKAAAAIFITKVENVSAPCSKAFASLEQQAVALPTLPASLPATAKVVEEQCESVSLTLSKIEPSDALKNSGDYLADWVTHLSRVAHARSTIAKAVRSYIRNKFFENQSMSKRDLEVYNDQRSGMLVEASEAAEALQKARSSLTGKK